MNNCPVCGYQMVNPPTDFHICPSCGTEFGYDDCGVSYESLRERWLASGPVWWSPVDPVPDSWSPSQQLMNGVFLSASVYKAQAEIAVYDNSSTSFLSAKVSTRRGRKIRVSVAPPRLGADYALAS